MKVLILSAAGNVHTQRWVSALASKGIEIFLFSLNGNGQEFYSQFSNVKVFYKDFENSTSYFNKLKYPSSVKYVKRLIKEIEPDIVHAHYASSYGLIGALVKTNVPYIISVWGSDVYDFPNITPFGKQIIKYNLKKADCILSTSHAMAKETYKYTDKEILITPFGVDIEHFKKIDGLQPIDEFIVGNVKTLSPKYGIDVLIRAFRIVLDNNPNLKTRLLIYGKGPCKQEYENLAKDLGIEDFVEFKGFIDNKKLPKVYNSFSVSVSVSNSESFGVVAVEAMACECPVVTSDADGFTEVVKNGETGYIVPKNNPVETAKAIQQFIDNPKLRTKMGECGRKRVTEFYDWYDNVNTMIDIYKNILKAYSDR